MLIPSENPTDKSIKIRLARGFSKIQLGFGIVGVVCGLGLDVVFNSNSFFFPVFSLGLITTLGSYTVYLRFQFVEIYRRYWRWFSLDLIITLGFLALEVAFTIVGNPDGVTSALLGVGIGSVVGLAFFWVLLIGNVGSIAKARKD